MKPVIAATITAYHEGARVLFATNAVEICVGDDTSILFLYVVAREVLITIAISVG